MALQIDHFGSINFAQLGPGTSFVHAEQLTIGTTQWTTETGSFAVSCAKSVRKRLMTISFEIPHEIEHALSSNGSDLSDEAREAFLVELYRQDRISHHQLTEALGLSRIETDGVLKRHKVSSGVTAEQMRIQAAGLRTAYTQ
jgi:predicted HTH domain antitoxin